MSHIETTKRKVVTCTNEDCGWHGERKTKTALDGPCPKCSSAVRLVVPGDEPEEALAPSYAPPPKPAKPFLGHRRFVLEVSVGGPARAMLAAMAGRLPIEVVAGELLDRIAGDRALAVAVQEGTLTSTHRPPTASLTTTSTPGTGSPR